MMMIRRRPTATRSYVRSYSARDTSWNSVGKAELSTLASFLPRDASCLFVDTSSNDYIPPSFSFSVPPPLSLLARSSISLETWRVEDLKIRTDGY